MRKKKVRETRIIQRQDTAFLLKLKCLNGRKSMWIFHSPDNLSNRTDCDCPYRFIGCSIKCRQQFVADTGTDPPF